MSIDSVKAIATVKASNLPPTFDIQVGTFAYPMELISMDRYFIYVRSTDTDETIRINKNEMVTILIPDTLDNAHLDISLDLMAKGII